MLFDLLYFVNLPVGQVKREDNLPEAISTCLGQALISSPEEGSGVLQTSQFHSTSSSDSYSFCDEVPVANFVTSNQKPSSNDNVILSKSGLPNQSHSFLAPYGPTSIVEHTDCLCDKFCRFCMWWDIF